jgi:hypothetical protein
MWEPLWEPTPWAMGVAHALKIHRPQGGLPQKQNDINKRN